jgi:DNA-binding MarR family transcriptional regulator
VDIRRISELREIDLGRQRVVGVDPIDQARAHWIAAGWGSTALAMATVTTIIRVQQILLAQITHALRPYGLSHARLEVLMVLRAGPAGGVPLGRLGAQLQVYPGAVTSSIKRLESDGLVRRVAHPTDGRGALARITPRGRRIVLKAVEDLSTKVLMRFEPSGAAGEQLFELLRGIRDAAGDLDPSHSESAA